MSDNKKIRIASYSIFGIAAVTVWSILWGHTYLACVAAVAIMIVGLSTISRITGIDDE